MKTILASNELLKKMSAKLVRWQYENIGNSNIDTLNIEALMNQKRTKTFLTLTNNGNAVGTISIIRDEYPLLPLPMETEFPEAVQPLRAMASARRIAQVGLFAIADEVRRSHSPKIICSLFASVLKYGVDENFYALVCVTHHNHRIYERMLFFEQIGEKKFYAPVGNWAVVKYISLDRAIRSAYLKKFFTRVMQTPGASS